MAYSNEGLYRSAVNMRGKGWAEILVCTLIGAGIATLYNQHLAYERHVLEALSLGKVKFDLLRAHDVATARIAIFAFFGFLVGMLRASTHIANGHKMLCMAEQEKHLRRIAEGLKDGRA